MSAKLTGGLLLGVFIITTPPPLKRHLPLHRGGVRSESPPCVKGDVSEADRGIVTGCFIITILPSRLRRATSPYTGEALCFSLQGEIFCRKWYIFLAPIKERRYTEHGLQHKMEKLDHRKRFQSLHGMQKLARYDFFHHGRAPYHPAHSFGM